MNQSDLLSINVNDHTEKKNGLTYLSWAWAWDQILRADPAATYEVLQFSDPSNPAMSIPYQSLGNSAIVWVAVTVFGKSITVQLPILDYRNKCIATPNAFDVNTSIMRCLTKGIAMHGLGLYIYAGEDLPIDANLAAKDQAAADEAAALRASVVMESVAKIHQDVLDCKSGEELLAVWNQNAAHIDLLRKKQPDLYAEIKQIFATQKNSFSFNL